MSVTATCKACGHHGQLGVFLILEIPPDQDASIVRVITDAFKSGKDFLIFQCKGCDKQGFVPDHFLVKA